VRTTALAALDRLAYRRALHLVAASDALADEVIASRVAAASRVSVVPPGRDVVEAERRPAGDLRAGRRCSVLCAANWVPRKGILDLIDAVARLEPDMVTLHLAGDDHADRRYAARIRRRLAAGDVAGRVVVHGALSQARLAAMYHAADVFALASTREPYGTVYGEAMAAGLPVVGWRAGNLPHLAGDGAEGLLVEPGDVDGLARALRRLAVAAELRGGLATAAAARAQRLPTWEESTAALLDGVRQVLARTRAEEGRRARRRAV
jgi:glycosyltransferase involved in cell wall biosynthesis